MHFSAAILAGGFSKRFGQDKALYPYKNKALLEWVEESLSCTDETFIIANRDYPDFKPNVFPDLIAQQGPLSGIHAALNHAKHDWVAVAACDMPFITKMYWQELWKHRSKDKQIIITSRQGKLEPLAAFYHKSCLSAIETYLGSGQRAAHLLIAQLETQIIPFETLALDSKILTNINTLTELEL